MTVVLGFNAALLALAAYFALTRGTRSSVRGLRSMGRTAAVIGLIAMAITLTSTLSLVSRDRIKPDDLREIWELGLVWLSFSVSLLALGLALVRRTKRT